MRTLIYALLISLLLNGIVAAEPIRLTNGEWPPYLGEQLPHRGVASRIVAEAFALQGIEVQWEFHPWARALQLAASGQRSGSAVWMHSQERDADFFFSDPVMESANVLFYRKDYTFDWKTISDLQDRRIVATRGYFYGEAFEEAEANGQLQVSRVTNDEIAFRQLLAGRIDLFPIDKVVGYATLNKGFSPAEQARLSVHPTPLTADSLHLVLSRQIAGNAELIERFNLGLEQLRDSGKIAQYLLDMQQPPQP
jgi:polar amino acid transport system substrate-binding protein